MSGSAYANVGDLLAAMLAEAGVRVVFGVPGGQTRPLYDGIEVRRPRIDHILMRDERNAACAADAYARVSGTLGVCDATVGPGATNLVSGLAEALNSSVAVLAVVADIPRAWEDRRAYGNASQGYNQAASLAPVVKRVVRLDDPAGAAAAIAGAIRTATTGRPGPVALEIPDDIFSGPLPPQAVPAVSGHWPAERPAADDAAVAAAAQLLRAARRPSLLAGSGAVVSGAWRAVAALADALDAPVLTSITGKGIVADEHPLAGGVAGVFGTTGANELLGAADAILSVGCKLGQLTTFSWRFPRPEQALVQLDIDPAEIGRVAQPAVGLVGDARAVLEQLLAAVEPCAGDDEWGRAAVEASRASWRRHNVAMTAEPGAADPRAVLEALNAVMPPEDVLVCDASLASGWGAAYFQVAEPGRRFIAPRGLAGIGWGGGAAIGAQAALGDAGRAWCLVGDGAWGYALQEVETAVRRGLPVVYVVLNNSLLAWIHHGRVASGKTLSSAFGDADYAMAARAFGAHGRRVGAGDDLTAALREAAAAGRCALLDVRSSQTLTPVLPAPEWARDEGATGHDADRH